MTPTTGDKPVAPSSESPDSKPEDAARQVPFITRLIRNFFSPSLGVIVMAIVVALMLSALLVALFDQDVQRTGSYLFARPGDFFGAFFGSIATFFSALFRGAIFDYNATTAAAALKPITETLTRAIPLVIAGLAVGVGFRAGLFNIGAQGQFIMGAILSGYLAISLPLPVGIHLLVVVAAAILGGAAWGFIPGILKAKVGANEVIVTIMLNSISLFFLALMLKQKFFVGAAGVVGKSTRIPDTAAYPKVFGTASNLHWGFAVALLAVVATWWILERSTFGFELRAAGANPAAARTAGINVNRVIVLTMVLSGALAGLASTSSVLGTERVLTDGIAGSYGFDAITVALLGKSRPWGTLAAGILFGAMNAGSSAMQGAGISSDIVQVTQAVIVLLIAASEAVRYFRQKRAIAQRATASVTKKEEAAA